jgi:uncharacterized protein YlxW (UPF0749 family)
MSVFSASIHHRSFVWQISVLCFVLGLLLAVAVSTSSQIGRTGAVPNRPGFYYGDNSGINVSAEKKNSDFQEEIKKLRADKTVLDKLVASGKDSTRALGHELQETMLLAGLTEAVGPGVTITLSDSKKQPLMGADPQSYLIHDRDLSEVVNELKASGAEAVAINGERVIASTAIRCAGPIILINGVKKTAPFVIQAIGDPDTMLNALNITNGVLDGIRRYDPAMAHADKQKSLHLAAFSGSTRLRYAKQPVASNSEPNKDSK